jgi:hypothetical protein
MEKKESLEKQDQAKEPEHAQDEQTGKVSKLEKKPKPKKPKKYARDEQTGKIFELEPEMTWDILAATISVLYSIIMLVFFSWLLFELCTGSRFLWKFLSLENTEILDSTLFRLIAYTVIGGGLGGTINGIRSFIIWHCERKAFGWRFVWKNITLPLLGAVLAAIVYAIVRGGIAAFGGGFVVPTESGPTQAFSAFAVGAIAGYGSHKVFRWLDEQVNKLFKISPPPETKVPDLKDKTKDEAETLLMEAKLNLGEVNYKPVEDPAKVDKVIGQNPLPDSKIPEGESVDITIGTKA